MAQPAITPAHKELISGPPQGQNVPALSSGHGEVSTSLCCATGSRRLVVGTSGIRYKVQMQWGTLRMSLATCIVSEFPG